MMNPQTRGRVLIVEDDVRVASGLKELLELYLYSVRVANSVQVAFQELVLDQFDVVVLDWILPDGDGREVIAFCREVSPTTSIVVSSAHRSSDGECTPSADEFVEKGPDVMPMRNAVERAMRLAYERRRSASDWRVAKYDLDAASTVLELLESKVQVDDHFGITCDSERMSAAIARYVGSSNYEQGDRAVVELDAKRPSQRDMMVRLFGHCVVQSGKRPALYPGLLDRGGASMLILRNADELPTRTQESVAESVATGFVRRVGSDRGIPVNIKLAVTFTPSSGKNKTPSMNRSLKRLLGDHLLCVPRLPEFAGGPQRVVGEFSRKRCTGAVLLNPGYAAMMRQGELAQSWDQLFPGLQRDDDRCDAAGLGLLDFPMMRPTAMDGDGGRQVISKWKDIKDIPQHLYVCRVLGITKGNVAEAVELSGIRRNTFYDVLKTYSISADQFRDEGETRTSAGA